MEYTQARRGLVIGAIVWSLIAAVTVVSALDDAAIIPGWLKSARANVLRVWPQGWAFFTRSPVKPDYEAYQIESDGHLRSALLGPYARPENLFGISRRARAQGPEIAILMSEVPSAAWQECQGPGYTPESCGASSAAPIALTNSSRIPSLCGRAFLAQDQAVPWAWQKLAHHQRRTLRMAAVNVTCTNR